MDWNVIKAFFETDHGQKLIKEALDKDQYWDKSKMGPTQDEVKVAHPQGGTCTTVVTPGKGGEGVYDVKSTDVKATGPNADGYVETISEVHDVVEEVARKEPKGVQGAAKKTVKTAKTVYLEKLADIATKLDEKGLTEEADLIDQIINEETQQ
jgi:hypothetical protein